jgi:hypothetical protein
MELSLIAKYAKVIVGIVIAVVIAALVGLAFEKTYQHGYNVAKALGDKSLSDYKASIAQASASAASDAFGRYAADVTRGQTAESGFLTARSFGAAQATVLKEHIDEVTASPVRAIQSGSTRQSVASFPAVPQCLFTVGFVRLWNAAAGIADDRDRALQAGTGTGNAADGPGTDAATCSGVSQADIIDWFIDYSNRARDTENKLKGVRAALPVQQ